MDHLQSDLDNSESERGQLKERLKTISKKTTLISGDDLAMNSTDRMYVQQISALREALKHENDQKCKLMAVDLKRKLNALEPLPTLPDAKSVERLQDLKKRYNYLKNVIFLFFQRRNVCIVTNVQLVFQEILKVPDTVPDLTLPAMKRKQEGLKKQQLLKALREESKKLSVSRRLHVKRGR